MLKKNEDIKLKIDGMTAEGSGVGHFDGQAVFVQNTVAGDEIDAHIMVAKKTYAVGKINKILKPSVDRISADCKVFEKCGGCTYRHISYTAEKAIKTQKVKDAFERIGHLSVPFEDILGAKEQDGYRNKAQFPVSKDTRNGEPIIGFYAANTHRIVPCKDCKLQSPAFLDVLNIVENWIKDFNISTYSEEKHEGLLRHIYIRVGTYSGQVMVCLVINGDSIPHEKELVEELTTGIKAIKTVVLNINKDHTNVILGKDIKVIYGDGYITDELKGKTFKISPLSFFQVNTKQCEILYSKAEEYADLSKDDILLDLYCGTGTIGLTMAEKVKKLIGVEIIPAAISDAKINARLNGIENAEFLCGDAAKIADKLKSDGLKPDVILVDPPRKGLDESLPKTIKDMGPKRIVYVSCDPATLARDCARFEAIGYKVQKVTPVDMFPRTAHVETVVLLSQAKGDL